ncbi:MAG: hypothetical protein ACQEVA_13025 [Myxococcota bacterium]
MSVFAILAIAAPSRGQESGGGVAVEASFAKLAEDYFLVPRLEAAYTWRVDAIACEEHEDCETSLRLAGQLPLRLRVGDRAPEQSSFIREADWDELADWFRVIRRAEYGRPDEPLHVKLGPLGPASLGHGTIIHDYYNVVSEDHYHPGATASFSTAYGGVEMLVDDVTEPRLMGTRIFVRPASFFDEESWAERIAVGGTFAADIKAPTELEMNSDGDIAVSETRSPTVVDSTSTAFMGIDAEVSAFEGEHFSLVPFVDYNAHLGFGSGVHAGGFLRFERDSFTTELRGEYRQTWGQYLPDYFGPLYQVDRFNFSGWGLSLSAPKIRGVASIPSQRRRGAAGGLTVSVEDLFTTELSYADHGSGANERLRFRTVVRPHERVHLGAFYFKQNFGELRNAFGLDDALLATEARVDVYAPIYVFGAYGRTWQLLPSDGYVTVDDWEAGVGASWRL